MADPNYDIIFSGELAPGADPHAVRGRIRALFKLPDETLDKLFSGRPVAIKRHADAGTAARFHEVFLGAGALVQIRPAAQAEATGLPEDRRTAEPDAGMQLQLAPVDGAPLEKAPEIPPLNIDISHLHLIQAEGWTLEDCAPPTPAANMPDISHLTLVESEPIERREPPED